VRQPFDRHRRAVYQPKTAPLDRDAAIMPPFLAASGTALEQQPVRFMTR